MILGGHFGSSHFGSRLVLLWFLLVFFGVTAPDASQGMEYRSRWLGTDHPRASPAFGELAQSWPQFSRHSSQVERCPFVRGSVASSAAIRPSPGKKDRIWHRLPPLPRGLRQLTFPNVKNDAGQKQCRRRLHKNTAYAHLWVSAALSVEHCRPQVGNVQQKGRLKVQRWVFRVFGVFRCSVWGSRGLLQGFYLARQKRPEM